MSTKKRRSERTSQVPRRDPLASLKMADLMVTKPFLPAELIEKIIDYLEIPDLLRFALVSRRTCEMVYDDTRWNKRLRRMGCWNEAQARQNADAGKEQGLLVSGNGQPHLQVNGQTPRSSPTRTDHGHLMSPLKTPQSAADGFSTVDFAVADASQRSAQPVKEMALTVLKRVQSIRGQSRGEYGKVYSALAPYYRDALANGSTQSLMFRSYTIPEQQATMLAQIKVFAKSDFSPGAQAREEKLNQLSNLLNTAALVEFRQAYEYRDIQGRMKQYAHVMHILDEGQTSIELYLSDNKLITQRSSFGNVGDCIDYSSGRGELSLERVQAYFERLGDAYAQEAAIIQTAFPQPQKVLLPFLEKVADEILSPFLALLFQDARTRGASTYLRVMSGTFAAIKQFIQTYTLPPEPDEQAISRTNDVMIKIYEPHIDTYLAEEMAFFNQKANREVEQWDQALTEQDTSTETFLMSNFNRQAEKKDFMSSFKKVVMAPVNILPSFSSTKSKTPANIDTLTVSNRVKRTSSPSFASTARSMTPTLPAEAPTSELAAKAALMSNKLETMNSLFSVEVALNLVHAAKSSLERAAHFISLKGEVGEKARKECSNIFVLLLDAVGDRHVRSGFDKAIDRLNAYNPREAHPSTTHRSSGQPIVAPLTTFVELVNVGDLIQQMVDVFFESELVAYGISRRDDFLDPPVKEKRKFEAMLDEHVASGLSKGIDVLMDEVEYLCATEQSPSDYNPALFDAAAMSDETAIKSSNRASLSLIPDIDITPTPTTLKIIRLISNHHTMLLGTTDKTLLEVFTTELGLRLFQALTKHIKRQRVSPMGAIRLLTDLTQYSSFIGTTFRNQELNMYFTALREVGQIFLIECKTDKEIDEMSGIIADHGRYGGVFGVEEVVEFAERRSDWIGIKGKVEGRIRGEGCTVM